MSNRIEFVQGDTAIFQIAITDADDNPLDLSGFVDMFFTLKRSRGDSDFAAIFAGSKINGDIDIVGDPTDGLIDVTIPSDSTILTRPNFPYYWDCKLLAADDSIYTVATGTAFADGTLLMTVES